MDAVTGTGGQERGASVVVITLAVGAFLGIVITAIAWINVSYARHGSLQLAEVSESASHHGSIAMALVLLAERLQNENLPPLIASQLDGVSPGVHIEDEGGKMSWPFMMYALPAMLSAFNANVPDMDDRVEELVERLGFGKIESPLMKYPVVMPAEAPLPVGRMECPEELGAWLELGGSDLKAVRRWFTPCETLGLNVNTADPTCVEGMLQWQRRSAVTWTDPVVKGDLVGGSSPFVANLYGLPAADSVVQGDPPGRPSALDMTLPVNSLIAVDPETATPNGYNVMWQLVQTALNAPFSVSWLDPPALRKAKFSTGTVSYPPKYSFNAYGVGLNAWLRFNSVTDASDVVGGRPYGPGQVTQPLGLLWYTPESYCLPISPALFGEYDKDSAGVVPTVDLHVAWSAAAFTGWLSVQGPGPYTTTSDWYTFEAATSRSGGSFVTRVTAQVWPDEMPRVIMASFDDE